ncbi:MAG: CoA-binding protein, partial [Chloroflexota bacterium]
MLATTDSAGSQRGIYTRAELARLIAPRSIAVVGASPRAGSFGLRTLENLAHFRGAIWPVNAKHREIAGHACFPALAALPGKPDLVALVVPRESVEAALGEAAAAGAGGVVVYASGYGEMGPEEGGAAQRRLGDIARAARMPMLGPNCMGVYNRPAKLNATYFWELPRTEGRVAFVSQSGAYGGMTFREMGRRGVGVSTFVSIGNQVDVTHADVLEHLAGDDECEVVALFIEEVRDGRRFLDACRRVARTKAVVAFKVGRTRAGRRAAQSHTGSMAGDAEVCRAALRQAGAFVARETDEFFDALAAYAAYPKGLRSGGGLAIVTISGGPCVAAADACEEAGVAVPELSATTQARVRALIPEFGAPRNPVDMTPQMDPERMPECVEAV